MFVLGEITSDLFLGRIFRFKQIVTKIYNVYEIQNIVMNINAFLIDTENKESKIIQLCKDKEIYDIKNFAKIGIIDKFNFDYNGRYFTIMMNDENKKSRFGFYFIKNKFCNLQPTNNKEFVGSKNNVIYRSAVIVEKDINDNYIDFNTNDLNLNIEFL